MPISSFSSYDLLQAMASVQDVIDTFYSEEAMTSDSALEQQDKFANLCRDQFDSDFGPSKRYLRDVLRAYITRIGELSLESDELLSLIARVFQTTNSSCAGGIPDPDQCCHASFAINQYITTKRKKIPLYVRVYPYHNDVGLRIWEAGAFLAEYILRFPETVRGLRVVELGAGTGLTGLVASGVCGASQVHCTDYTDHCLQNMLHNISINHAWLEELWGIQLTEDSMKSVISSGYLEWGLFDSRGAVSASCDALNKADVLLAADVLYDKSSIDPLLQTLKEFLGSISQPRKVLIATTKRNVATFELFQRKLPEYQIRSSFLVKEGACGDIPVVFPAKFTQSRFDVSILLLTSI